MKIQFEKYNPGWKRSFEKIKEELEQLIGSLHPEIEHIGSTSVDGLSAKPIIDILIGIEGGNDLDKVIHPLVQQGYIYYEIYNEDMPYRRFFVKHKPNAEGLNIPAIIRNDKDVPRNTDEHGQRLAHVHVLPFRSEHWVRHIAFRDYLRIHPDVREEYQKLKETLCVKDWADGNDYNKAKDRFMKTEEQHAVEWYNQ